MDVEEAVSGVPLSMAELRGCDPITAAKGKLHAVTSMELAESAAAHVQASLSAATEAQASSVHSPLSDAPPAYEASASAVTPSAPLPGYEESVAQADKVA